MTITERSPLLGAVADRPRAHARTPIAARDIILGPLRSACRRISPGPSIAVLLASLSIGAAVIHLAMAPAHAGEWKAEGIAFAVVGTLQVVVAYLLVTQLSRAVLWVGSMMNALFIGAWVITRTSGMPWGPERGAIEKVGFVDVTCVALESVLVLVSLAVLAHPNLGASMGARARRLFAAVPLGILVLAAATTVSGNATNHVHDQMVGMAGMVGDQMTAAATGHSHPAGTSTDDKGLSKVMNGEGADGMHMHTYRWKKLDPLTQKRLDEQLAQTKLLAAKYPTVQAAEAAGYRRQGPYAPGIGAHYANNSEMNLNTSGVIDDQTVKTPLLIFDGVKPDSKIAGFMYIAYTPDKSVAPEGFAGDNDHWHYHENVCITGRPGGGIDAPLGADATATKALCDKYNGVLIPYTGYMLHVWTVKGYESPQGVFSNVNSKLTCPNGTYYEVPQDQIGYRSNVCKDVPADG